MKFYFAPMEGLTGYIYRNAYERHFHNVDRYFTPFVAASSNRALKKKEIRDFLPENNLSKSVVPQILASRADDYLFVAGEIAKYGYEEVNLNLGCPSMTVVTKKKGSGFLAFPEELDEFLAEIFEKSPCKISIKTRIGKEDPEEFGRILDIYKKYPYTELIIHPRCQKEFYKGTPHLEAFDLAVEMGMKNLCYNGDIYSRQDYERIVNRYPELDRVMMGRGILTCPGLIGEILTGEKASVDVVRSFAEEIQKEYYDLMQDEKNTLFKMKEFWIYLADGFAGSEKYAKQIKKAQRLSDLSIAADGIFRHCEWK